MNKGIIHDALILFVITLIAGLALGAVHDITLEPIAIAQKAQATATYKEVFAEAASFGEEMAVTPEESAQAVEGKNFGKVTVDGYMDALDASGQVLGHIVMATSADGYKGPVQVAVGIDQDGKVLGIGFLSIDETPGLGMKAKEPAFKGQFAGKKVEEFAVTKVGASGDDQINAISGATFTSLATTNAVNAAVAYAAGLTE